MGGKPAASRAEWIRDQSRHGIYGLVGRKLADPIIKNRVLRPHLGNIPGTGARRAPTTHARGNRPYEPDRKNNSRRETAIFRPLLVLTNRSNAWARPTSDTV